MYNYYANDIPIPFWFRFRVLEVMAYNYKYVLSLTCFFAVHYALDIYLLNPSIVLVGSNNHGTQTIKYHHYTNNMTTFNKKDENLYTMITVMSIKSCNFNL